MAISIWISKSFWQNGAICAIFIWLGRISDPIQNPGRLQPNLFLTIQNPDQSRFQIPTASENLFYFKIKYQK